MALCAGAMAADWPQWRGPTRDGVATGVTLPDPWPKALEQAWQLEVGLGHSSPVVAGGKLVQLSRQGDNEVVRCLDAASGKEAWKDSYAAGGFSPQAVARYHARGPFATPTIADGKVYTLGVSGELTCYGLAGGKRLWRHADGDYKKPYPMWGAANSPLIDGKRCILGLGTDRDGALIALDKDTGEPVWKNADDGPGYASPQIATLAGERQIVTLTHSRVVGVDPATGKSLWHLAYKVKYDMNIISPVLHGDLVVYSGYHDPTAALRIRADGDKLTASKAWTNKAESMFMSSPVRHGEHIYGFVQRGKGTLVCLALADGKTAWSSPGRMGEYVSIVRVGDKLLVLTTKGDLLLVAADPTAYRELGRAHLADRPVWAHLAVTGDRIYVKDKTHLSCFSLAGQ
jgi:outer membrane protein assembly factor BamB